MKSYDKFLTPKDIQCILGLSKNKVYELINQQDFPKIKFGRTIRVPQNKFDEYMERLVQRSLRNG